MWVLVVLLATGGATDTTVTVPGYDLLTTCQSVGKYLLREHGVLNQKGIVHDFLCVPGPKAVFPEH